mmetsp:Transcript_14218/g.37574  ORF Transcript_14218/g.37574 Transcript_14218/m.37574 type:complete len:266 (+) Transcript_14218:489-1286(+)
MRTNVDSPPGEVWVLSLESLPEREKVDSAFASCGKSAASLLKSRQCSGNCSRNEKRRANSSTRPSTSLYLPTVSAGSTFHFAISSATVSLPAPTSIGSGSSSPMQLSKKPLDVRAFFFALRGGEARSPRPASAREQAWLSKRCLMQRGCTVEAEPLIKALHPIPLLPQVWTQRATASCNCGDFASHRWCKHVAALGYHLIDTCGAQPLYLCHLRQFGLVGLLRSRLPRKRARDSSSDEVIALLSDDEESDSGTRHGASCNNPIVL